MRVSLLLFLCCCGSGCGLTTPPPSLRLPPGIQKSQLLLAGSFQALDGEFIDLTKEPEKIKIVMLASEICKNCKHEALALVKDRLERGKASNVKFYSILIGADLEEAAGWAARLGVDWEVGIDVDDKIFRSYCPENLTPCVLIYNPETKDTSKVVGASSLVEWERLGGAWRF